MEGLNINLNEPKAIINVTSEEFRDLNKEGSVFLKDRETEIVTEEGIRYELSGKDIVIAHDVGNGSEYFCKIETVYYVCGTIKLKKISAVF